MTDKTTPAGHRLEIAMVVWRDARMEVPRENAPIVMVGDSGYILPHNTAVFCGYYNASYHPFAPWMLYDNSSVEDFGVTVQWWCYLEDLNLPR